MTNYTDLAKKYCLFDYGVDKEIINNFANQVANEIIEQCALKVIQQPGIDRYSPARSIRSLNTQT